MKVSASPKPASGPVLGLTWPILMTLAWALAELAPSSAGAATTAAPDLMSVRRLMRCVVLMFASLNRSGVSRLFQMLQNLAAQRRLFAGAPLAEALAALEAELTFGHQPLQIRRRPGPMVDVRQHGLMNRQRQIGADQIGILQGPKHREPSAERRF